MRASSGAVGARSASPITRVADRVVADEVRDVDAEPGPLRRIHVRRQRQWTPAIGAAEGQRHPLPHVALSGRQAQERFEVCVQVDEPRRHDAPRGVDHPACARRVDRGRRHARNAIPLHGDVGAVTRAPRAIDDGAAANQEVVGRPALPLREPGSCTREDRDGDEHRRPPATRGAHEHEQASGKGTRGKLSPRAPLGKLSCRASPAPSRPSVPRSSPTTGARPPVRPMPRSSSRRGRRSRRRGRRCTGPARG
jgi:hypothetical protein